MSRLISSAVSRILVALILFSLTGCSGTTAVAVAEPPIMRNNITGEPLEFSGLNETETPAVKQFKATGKNPYNTDREAIAKGGAVYLTACSACHGHHAEGKIAPALIDDYWTYPMNTTDIGLFSSTYAGLQGMMGPSKGRLTQDEILQLMAWIRSNYKGDPAKAEWNH
ncbi:MAG: cytochrome c(L), periplasmic [Candidatus Methylomirabilis oxygeniifera]|uniref:MxaG (Cytochrome c1) involved in Methanol dehydrogenase (MxaG1) n=1 Tax=Methylomirabilis oxygeniifera TaxID=671143 RepID=D5MI80_METO1|nr:MAG: cytochrome c(L), periplasmic [Candidatus Methylomirabilis oxyfera]CBE67230.1 mxaG (Cytochrome c1 precursor) involved in Methanol dehydrogenase (mxaG1) [Candidatus Methylomirabilis oxyfera]